MSYSVNFFTYRRPFITPLQTSHGIWSVREGIITQLSDKNNQIARGEIAPLPWFGTETIEQAKLFCQQLGNQITESQIRNISDRLPACQFGFESAWINLKDQKTVVSKPPKGCYLLPAGERALFQYHVGLKQGYKTFKWKIGVESIKNEISFLKRLIKLLPTNIKIRLDANGGLTLPEAKTWLQITDTLEVIEFIEQPLPPNQFDEMLALNVNYKTPLALDESVANLKQLTDCYQRGWRGIFVIKAAIMGFPSHLRQLCQTHPMDLVFSSVFETEVGRQFSLNLAAELMKNNRAVGFGINDWFSDKIT